MRYRAAATLAAVALALTACGASEVEESTTASEAASEQGRDLLVEHGLDGLDAEEIVDHLDLLPLAERPTDLIASVRPGSLVLSGGTGGEEVELDLPEDLFYLSMAPYVDQTHDCFHHSLTTCLGELRGEEVTVTITDDTDDTVLVQETASTFDNGFVGYWLPSDIDATITVEHQGRTASTRISTGEDDPTCLTTLALT
ncbi:CueP family metal-binding protein [Nocardiopsis alkaliphila]|uniref:CueP family metal-binding protein n=1 Tax=Nocardiopsis alkaliphila TaxID=225762 RepID=UPI0004777ACA|nr:CueP family metal-binding protein [Nocardiopsis alkaliphila]